MMDYQNLQWPQWQYFNWQFTAICLDRLFDSFSDESQILTIETAMMLEMDTDSGRIFATRTSVMMKVTV